MPNHMTEEEKDGNKSQEYSSTSLSTSAHSDPAAWMEDQSKKSQKQKQPLQRSKSSESLERQRHLQGWKQYHPAYHKKHSSHHTHYRPQAHQEFDEDTPDYIDDYDYPYDYPSVPFPLHTPRVEQLSAQEVQLVIQDNRFLHSQLHSIRHRFQAEKTDLQRRLRHLTARVHYLEGLKKCSHHSPEENTKPYHMQQGKRYMRHNHPKKLNKHNNENNDEACATSEDHYPVDESADLTSHDKRQSKDIGPPSLSSHYLPHHDSRPFKDRPNELSEQQERDKKDYPETQYEIESDYIDEPYPLRHHAQYDRLPHHFYPSIPVIYGPPPPPPPPMAYPPFMHYGPPRMMKTNRSRRPFGHQRHSYSGYMPSEEAEMKPFVDDEEDMQLLFDQISMNNLPPPSVIMPPPPFAPISLSDESLPMPYLPHLPPPPPPLPGHLVSQTHDLAGPLRRASSRRSASESVGSNNNRRNSYI
ncbi:hypothetical protein BD560DRAFT_431504 [Blakeslea trispora]|nr:hypothetical protein BD560DRAFT_431504 [Blakeslea trispora]